MRLIFPGVVGSTYVFKRRRGGIKRERLRVGAWEQRKERLEEWVLGERGKKIGGREIRKEWEVSGLYSRGAVIVRARLPRGNFPTLCLAASHGELYDVSFAESWSSWQQHTNARTLGCNQWYYNIHYNYNIHKYSTTIMCPLIETWVCPTTQQHIIYEYQFTLFLSPVQNSWSHTEGQEGCGNRRKTRSNTRRGLLVNGYQRESLVANVTHLCPLEDMHQCCTWIWHVHGHEAWLQVCLLSHSLFFSAITRGNFTKERVINCFPIFHHWYRFFPLTKPWRFLPQKTFF